MKTLEKILDKIYNRNKVSIANGGKLGNPVSGATYIDAQAQRRSFMFYSNQDGTVTITEKEGASYDMVVVSSQFYPIEAYHISSTTISSIIMYPV